MASYVRHFGMLVAVLASVTFADNSTCSMLEAKSCWENPKGKIAHVCAPSNDPQSCCSLCSANDKCVTWTLGSKGSSSAKHCKTSDYMCDLYETIGPIQSGKTSGCTSGYRAGAVPTPAPPAPPAPRGDRPNIVFLVVESTDGRTWQRGYQNDVIPLPNIRELQEHGVAFHRHYANAPVCCPSRATFWSGRHAHKIPHSSAQKGGPTDVQGAWNNFEGLPPDFDERIDQVIGAAGVGYNAKITGKTDWTTGAHSENVYLNSWNMYTRFPYNVSATGGWADEDGCVTNGTVSKGGGPRGKDSAHASDWSTVKDGTKFIADATKDKDKDNTPFFIYQGMNIVHPPYKTNEYWYNQIDPSKIEVPDWAPLQEMHPCDFQSSMLKGCLGADDPDAKNSVAFMEAASRRRNVRRIYYAMVAEFDDMVGAYMDAVKAAGVWNQTVFIVTSDHGDMQMEHRQFYKMVPRDPSASVPMVIFDGRPGRQMPSPKVVTEPTQLIDIAPTVFDYAGVPADAASRAPLDGFSLLPHMQPGTQMEQAAPAAGAAAVGTGTAKGTRPPFVTSQFHGCNIAMSWFLIVQNFGNRTYKLIQWGTGEQVPAQLFDLTQDPGEFTSLVSADAPNGTDPSLAPIIETMRSNLLATIDYPDVARNVAQYNKDSLYAWVNHTKDWESAIHHSGLRWDNSWSYDPKGAIAAVHEFMQQPAEVLPCRSDLVWPPPNSTA